MKSPTEEIQYLGEMLYATTGDDAPRLLSISKRIADIAAANPGTVKDQDGNVHLAVSVNTPNYWSLDCDIIAGPQESGVKIGTAGTPSIAAEIVNKLNITPGAAMIAAERDRQISFLGWDQFHDDRYDKGELAHAAGCYLDPPDHNGMPSMWPWDKDSWRPSTKMRNLVKAGALIAAELDRLLREDASMDSQNR